MAVEQEALAATLSLQRSDRVHALADDRLQRGIETELAHPVDHECCKLSFAFGFGVALLSGHGTQEFERRLFIEAGD